jgi:adenylate cyclase
MGSHPLVAIGAAASVGDREAANAAAAALDRRPAGAVHLALISLIGFCGAPFDLDATPNFAARLDEAGAAWPPPSPIVFPAKDW